MTAIVFLHIPKTAGQTVHSELSKMVGAEKTSPIRVHTQAPDAAQFPTGYDLYSGHLDWLDLDCVQGNRFVFTILRDPFERIASFYFYLHHKAFSMTSVALAEPENTGLRKIRGMSVDDYFFGGDAAWQRFILDHYDNFYTAYLATRKIRGSATFGHLHKDEKIQLALYGAARLDRIYAIEKLEKLELDLFRLTGKKIAVTDKRINPGPKAADTRRSPALLDLVECDRNKRKLGHFAALDSELMGLLTAKGLLS